MKKKLDLLTDFAIPTNSRINCASLCKGTCKFFACGDETKSIFLYNTENNQPIQNFIGIPSNASFLLLNNEEKYFFSGLKGGSIISWDLDNGKIKANLQAHKSEIKSLYLAKNQSPNLLASASSDGKIKIWDLRGKNSSISIKGHLECVNCITISPDCYYLASGANDNLLKIWDIRQNKLIKDLSVPEQTAVNCVEFNPHCITLAYGSSDKTIKHWDLERYELISITPMDKLPAMKLAFDSTGKNIYIGTHEGFKYWMIDDDKPELIDMFETGFNNLQDLCYRDREGLYAVSIYGSKISTWFFSQDKIGGNKIDAAKRSNSVLIGNNKIDENNQSIRSLIRDVNKKINRDLNLNSKGSPRTSRVKNSRKSIEKYINSSSNRHSSQQKKFDMHVIKENENFNKSDDEKYNFDNNKNLNLNNIAVEDNFDVDAFIEEETGKIQRRHTDLSTTNISFFNVEKDQVMNLDYNYFLNGHSLNETNKISHSTPSSNKNLIKDKQIDGGENNKNRKSVQNDNKHQEDFNIIQEISFKHLDFKKIYEARMNKLKMIEKYLLQKDLSSALNYLSFTKDNYILNDFYANIFFFEDNIKYNLRFDDLLIILQNITILLNSKKNSHRKTGLTSALKFIKIIIEKFSIVKNSNLNKCFSQKFSNGLKNNIFADDENEGSVKKEGNPSRFNEILDNLNNLFKDKILKDIAKNNESPENSKLAGMLISDLEIFLSTNEKL